MTIYIDSGVDAKQQLALPSEAAIPQTCHPECRSSHGKDDVQENSPLGCEAVNSYAAKQRRGTESWQGDATARPPRWM
jgi:hypothetical protein